MTIMVLTPSTAKCAAWPYQRAKKTSCYKFLLISTATTMSTVLLLVNYALSPMSKMSAVHRRENDVGMSQQPSGQALDTGTSSPSSTNRSPDIAQSSTFIHVDEEHRYSATHCAEDQLWPKIPMTLRPKDMRMSPTRLPKSRTCPMGGVATVVECIHIGLGNKMWHYATTWATALDTGLDSFVPRSLRRELDQVFHDLSVSSLEAIAHCYIDWKDTVSSPYNWSHIPTQNILLPAYPFHEEVALRRIDELRREFSFREDLVTTSRRVLGDVGRSANVSGGEVTFVGVHVRRTDYSHHLWVRGKAVLAEVSFFLDAMEYFRGKYGGGVVFVVASDEPEWCRQKLAAGRGDVFVVGGAGQSTPEQDLAVLSSCNHSIIDYGTFGSWAAIFANGETVVFNLSIAEETSMILLKYFPNWNVMD